MKTEERNKVKLAQQGDADVLAELIQEHYSFLYKYLVKVTMDPAMAEDLAQDTILRCIEKIRLHDGSSSFSSWLMTMGTRIYIDQMRRKKREKNWLFKERGIRRIRWQFESRNEEWNDVLESLANLSSEHRVTVLLKHYYGYTYEEIGEMLSIPSGTVKSRVATGVRQLREEMS
ncbi:RNA polymerase sigma factor SigY [Paenibacillus macquariensis]|uniref:RNA polymerase, sigma subunit, SigY n=1 Tax=Paenibacillus macquariensis TaxID=948756 RepID=A0ABY1K8C5_9BACL|nr:RNA polymerase sigma factor SigY [Paenibacillus macquariensis]MEC0093241.1 RNA polymerase sigma factor SigY [Paenibacillus macquariensis]OAB27592.1 RNA polymerase sigma factor SigY [Paenibacillus macquariensis subsp. macquariensis]SIR40561.1 RNA polymerase, sigma subunit, SigY [Paenibacillus macquariensis]